MNRYEIESTVTALVEQGVLVEQDNFPDEPATTFTLTEKGATLLFRMMELLSEGLANED